MKTWQNYKEAKTDRFNDDIDWPAIPESITP